MLSYDQPDGADGFKEQPPDLDDIYAPLGSKNAIEVDGLDEPGGEIHASARAGSTGSMDAIGEDFNKNPAARATGFMGKNSELVWIQRLSQQAELTSGSDSSSSISGRARSTQEERETLTTRISDVTYHSDNLPIMVSEQVDAYELPPRHIADILFQAYLDTVHPAFPILGKETFVNQYNTFSGSQGVKPGDNWRAVLNLIFAIAARYAHLIQADWRGDERDHLIYFTRARMLGFNGDSILDHPELQQIQISGLMAFYLASTDQINRYADNALYI